MAGLGEASGDLTWGFPKIRVPLKGYYKSSIKGLGFRVSQN